MRRILHKSRAVSNRTNACHHAQHAPTRYAPDLQIHSTLIKRFVTVGHQSQTGSVIVPIWGQTIRRQACQPQVLAQHRWLSSDWKRALSGRLRKKGCRSCSLRKRIPGLDLRRPKYKKARAMRADHSVSESESGGAGIDNRTSIQLLSGTSSGAPFPSTISPSSLSVHRCL